jgi:hypothetical protein
MFIKPLPPLLEKERLAYRRPIEEVIADLRQPDPKYKRLVFNEEAYRAICYKGESPVF